MKIKKVIAENFLSIGKMEFNYSKTGITSVDGYDENLGVNTGAGKSSFLDVIAYGLFGKISKDVSPDEIINRKAKKNLYVRIELELDNLSMAIVRTRKHKKYGNDLWIDNGTEELRGKDAKETQTNIEQLLGINFETFSKLTYFSQFSPMDRFLSATDGEKKALLSEICELGYYDNVAVDVKTDIAQLENQISSLKRDIAYREQEIATHKTQSESLMRVKLNWEQSQKSKIEDARFRIINFDSTIQAKKNQLTEKLTKLSGDLSQAKESITTLQALIKDVSHLTEIENKLREHLTFISNAELKLSQLTFSKDSIIKVINGLKSKIDNQNKKAGITCLSCGQVVTQDHINKVVAEYETEIQKQNEELNKVECNIAPLQEALSQISKTVVNQKLEQIIKEQKDNYQNEAQLRQQQRYVAQLESMVASTHQEIVSVGEAQNPYVVMLKDLEAQTNPYENQEINSDKIIEEKQNEINEFQVKIQNHEKKLQLASWWLHALRVYIRSYLIDSFLEQINLITNEYLETLFSGILKLNISATTEKGKEVKEKISVTIFNNGTECSYESLSGGERSRICLAVNLALSDLTAKTSKKSCNVLMLDEIFTGLDEVGKNQTLKLLKDLEEKYDAIYVIDHTESFKNMFTNTVKIRKKDEISYIDSPESV